MVRLVIRFLLLDFISTQFLIFLLLQILVLMVSLVHRGKHHRHRDLIRFNIVGEYSPTDPGDAHLTLITEGEEQGSIGFGIELDTPHICIC